MAKFCQLCGTPCEQGAKFCSESGAVLINRIDASAEAPKNNDVQPPKTEEPAGFTEVKAEIPVENAGGNNETADTFVVFNGEQQPTPTENTYGAPNSNNLYGNYGSPNRSNPYGNYGSPNGNNTYGGNPYGGSDYNTFNNNTQNGGAQENPYANMKAPVKQQRSMNMGTIHGFALLLSLDFISVHSF